MRLLFVLLKGRYSKVALFLSLFVNYVNCQTIRPAWLDQTQRPPPPAQSQQAIDKLISDILSGDNANTNINNNRNNEQRGKSAGFNGFNSVVEETNDVGPLAIANSSNYWSWNTVRPKHSIVDESEARAFIAEYDSEAQKVYSASVEAGWNYFTNLTEYNRKNLVYSDILLSQFLKLTALKAQQFDESALLNDTVKRLVGKLSLEGLSALSERKYKQLTMIQTEMNQIYSNGAVCEEGRPPPCTLQLEPDLSNIMATSTDYTRLYYVWLAWRNSVGPQMRNKYLQLMQLSNEGARLNGFSDAGEMWRNAYESPELERTVDGLFTQIKPLFLQLHAYVRRSLMKLYPDYVQKIAPIPAHLLGNMWASSWINLYESSAPYPNKLNANDPSNAMRIKNYTVENMFRQAASFYESLGFGKLPDSFWRKSMFVRPKDRDALCVPAAVDFRNGIDFRVKMCAQVSFDDFLRAHHELGHVYYFLSYKNQFIPFRDGANPAFLDAVGALSALSARTANYLTTAGLGDFDNDPESDMNYLYRTALDRIVFMSYAFASEKWRWKVANGEYNDTNMERAWWDLRQKNQGLYSAAERTERDFDPGSNIQLVQNLPLLQHFIGFVLQFQMFKSLCTAAGHVGPLITCDFHNSKEAGYKLKLMMTMGSSKPWPEALEALTGSKTLSASAMLEYFQPLQRWLEHQNSENSDFVGWNDPKSIIKVLKPETFDNTNNINIHNVSGTRFVFNGDPESPGAGYTGSTCSQSQQCAEGSVCNGTHCVCPKQMVQWYQLCLPNDPTLVGLGPAGSFDLHIVKGNKTANQFHKSVLLKDDSSAFSISPKITAVLFSAFLILWVL